MSVTMVFLVLAASLFMEFVWTHWTTAVARGQPIRSGLLAGALVLGTALLIREYNETPHLIPVVAVGTSIGSCLSVYLSNRGANRERSNSETTSLF